jgi:hypothetical protein
MKIFLRILRRLLVTSNVVPSSPILATLMMEELGFSEMSVLTRATQRNILEDDIFHSHRSGNLKSYKKTNILCRVKRYILYADYRLNIT